MVQPLTGSSSISRCCQNQATAAAVTSAWAINSKTWYAPPSIRLATISLPWNGSRRPRPRITCHSIAKAIRNSGVIAVSTTCFQSMCGPNIVSISSISTALSPLCRDVDSRRIPLARLDRPAVILLIFHANRRTRAPPMQGQVSATYVRLLHEYLAARGLDAVAVLGEAAPADDGSGLARRTGDALGSAAGACRCGAAGTGAGA